MSQYDELKRLVEAASPAVVLALISEIEALKGLCRMYKETETRAMRDLKVERDQLRVENLRLHRDLGRAGRNLHQAVESLRRDAERYRWLRDGASVILSESVGFTAESGARIYSTMPTQRELDSAIDAASAGNEVQPCTFTN